jgi:uncharacterized membrane protein
MSPAGRRPDAGCGGTMPGMLLSRSNRKLVLVLHVLASVGWVGADLVIGVFSITGLLTDDPATMALCYRALHLFGVPLLLTLGLLSLGTGLLLGIGTRFGLVRHWWVAVKLVLTVVLTTLVVVALRPALDQGAAASAVVDASLADRLGQVRTDLLFPPLVSTSALVFATVLAVYKPWGRTPWSRR